MKFNLRAFFNHLLVSIAIVGLFALIILTVWYPSIWSKALGGYDLFIKILIFDLVAGPVCMGLVYKTHKSVREKIIDVVLIMTFQLGFLGYGLWVLSESRPAFIVFSHDRYEAYVVNEMDPASLKTAEYYNKIPLTGPVYVGIDLEEIGDRAIDYLMAGIDVSQDPQFYQPIDKFADQIRARRHSYQSLKEGNLKTELERWAKKNKTVLDDLSIVPVKHRSIEKGVGFITAILVGDDYLPDDYLQIDPYDSFEEGATSSGIEMSSKPQGSGINEEEAISQDIDSIIQEVEGGVNHYKNQRISRDMDLRGIQSKIELHSRSQADDLK